MLKADLHIHTRFSPDSELSPERLVERCLKVGLNCIAVTDHNSIEGALAVKEIAPFRVIVGEEIASASGEVTGLFLEREVPANLPAKETGRLIKEQGGLVSLPHPFDRFRSKVITPDGIDEILPHVEIVEAFNARNNFNSDNLRAEELARQHGLLVSAVSDSHTAVELGRTYTEIPDFDGTAEGFKQALTNATLVRKRTTPLIHVLTTLTKAKKRILGRTRH